MKADYTMRQIEMVDDISTSSVLLKSTARFRYSKRQSKNLDFTIFVDAGRIARFEIDTDNFKLKAVETKS
jgi:hypothetical protein